MPRADSANGVKLHSAGRAANRAPATFQLWGAFEMVGGKALGDGLRQRLQACAVAEVGRCCAPRSAGTDVPRFSDAMTLKEAALLLVGERTRPVVGFRHAPKRRDPIVAAAAGTAAALPRIAGATSGSLGVATLLQRNDRRSSGAATANYCDHDEAGVSAEDPSDLELRQVRVSRCCSVSRRRRASLVSAQGREVGGGVETLDR
jgi:hypothetical protein